MATKEFYLGGNTTEGFFSYYEYLIRPETAKRVVCIKGGPGTGKSSLMRKIAINMSMRRLDTEIMHCSADPNSLDGVAVPRLGLAFVDGTSPHVVDPKYPGAVDEILNLGDYWDKGEIEKNKPQIISCQNDISECYKISYNYLKAAKAFYQNILNVNHAAANPVGVHLEGEALMGEFAEIPYAKAPGYRRKLFASAITSDGVKNYLDTIITQRNVYVLQGEWGTGTDTLLDRIAEEAVMRGFYVEAYYCPLSPRDRVEHVVIPALSLSFTTDNKYHKSGSGEKIINMNEYCDKSALNRKYDILEYNSAMFDTLLQKAVDVLAAAKKLHDQLETYYIPYMDFERINILVENVINQNY